jgi:hypothetical protein
VSCGRFDNSDDYLNYWCILPGDMYSGFMV